MNSPPSPPSTGPSLRFLRHAFNPRLQSYVEHLLGDSTHDRDHASSRLEPPEVVLTRYMKMLLQLDAIPTVQNALAGLFTWILLAGYLVFPGTFTSLRQSKTVQEAAHNHPAGQSVVNSVQNVPLLWLAAICCIGGVVGMCWLWWRWHENYVWLTNRIFLPGLLNSVAGFITTLVNVYSAQGGSWSVTARITGVVTGACVANLLALFLLYNNWLLADVKRDHRLRLNAERDRVQS